MNGLLQGKEAANKRQRATELARRSRAHFTVRSLGGKLVISATLTLLLCLLLFAAFSWYLVKAFYEREARNASSVHLNSISQAYLEQSGASLHELAALAASTDVAGVLTQQEGAQGRLMTLLTMDLARDRLASLALVDTNGRGLAQVGEHLPGGLRALLDASLSGRAGTLLARQGNAWLLALETPVRAANGRVVGALVGTQPLDNFFADDLAKSNGPQVILCQGGQMLGSSERAFLQSLHGQSAAICAPGNTRIVESGRA